MTQARKDFEDWVLHYTGRDMKYHQEYGTTDLESCWAAYLQGLTEASKRAQAARSDQEQGGGSPKDCNVSCQVSCAGWCDDNS